MTQFTWKSSYLNEVWFQVVTDDGDSFEVVYRTGVSDYERSIHNGGAAAYAVDCEPLIGFLRRELGYLPLSLDIVRDFNTWRGVERDHWIEKMEKFSDRYGPVTPAEREITLLAVGGAQWTGGRAKDGGHWRLDCLQEPVKQAA